MSSVQLPGNYLSEVLADLGAPETPPNLAVLSAIGAEEHGSVDTNPDTETGGTNQGGAYNLIDSTLSAPGATPYNTLSGGGHVFDYPSAAVGVAANVATLEEPQFAPLTNALRAGKSSLSGLVADANETPFLGYRDGKPIPFLAVPSPSAPGEGEIFASGAIGNAVQEAIGYPNEVFGASYDVTGAQPSADASQLLSKIGLDSGAVGAGFGPAIGNGGFLLNTSPRGGTGSIDTTGVGDDLGSEVLAYVLKGVAALVGAGLIVLALREAGGSKRSRRPLDAAPAPLGEAAAL